MPLAFAVITDSNSPITAAWGLDIIIRTGLSRRAMFSFSV